MRKHGADKRRQWRKAHLAVDTQTGMIHAVETTGNEIADGTVLPDLLERIPQPIQEVKADGAYDWRSRYAAIAGCAMRPSRGAGQER